MRALSSLGIGLSLVSGFLLLALLAELYYLLCWKKRTPNREIEELEEAASYKSPARELLYLFCWKKPNSLSSTALNPQEISAESNENHQQHKDLLIPFGEEGMEAELMRLHSLSGPPRFLFTIKEETKEDLESEDGRSRGGRSRKSSRGRSLSDVLLAAETPPFSTPLSSPPFFTPPLTPLDCYNPLFESAKSDEVNFSRMARAKASPPPKFKFLRDAEEKLYKRTLTEEAMRLHKMNASDSVAANSPSKGKDEEDASFITIIIGKNREKGNHHPSSSQVNPLPTHGKLSSYLSSGQS